MTPRHYENVSIMHKTTSYTSIKYNKTTTKEAKKQGRPEDKAIFSWNFLSLSYDHELRV